MLGFAFWLDYVVFFSQHIDIFVILVCSWSLTFFWIAFEFRFI